MKYRVLYGEQVPAWHRDFATKDATLKFVAQCMRNGDIVFGVGVLSDIAMGLLNKEGK